MNHNKLNIWGFYPLDYCNIAFIPPYAVENCPVCSSTKFENLFVFAAVRLILSSLQGWTSQQKNFFLINYQKGNCPGEKEETVWQGICFEWSLIDDFCSNKTAGLYSLSRERVWIRRNSYRIHSENKNVELIRKWSSTLPTSSASEEWKDTVNSVISALK